MPIQLIKHPKTLMIGALLLALSAAGCADSSTSRPMSLKAPRSIAFASGPVCLESAEISSGVVQGQTIACPDGERGAIGLIANQEGDSVSVIDMGQRGRAQAHTPRLVDMDLGTPGVSGIKVGRSPGDIAAGHTAAAYVINQADRSVSVIDLWNMLALPRTINFERAPTHISLTPALFGEEGAPGGAADDPGRVVVGLSGPPQLWINEGVQCGCEDADGDECTPDKVECSAVPTEAHGVEVDLPGPVADMTHSPDGELVYVVYRDQPFASVVAVRDAVPEAFPEGCLDGGQAPCEVGRIGLTFDCSNGVDDDGDGLIDQEDPQCFDPLGFESPDGIGRSPIGSCSNGVDDDGDGLIDREDPNCLWSGDDESTPPIPGAEPACSDGVDNDRDGATDYPEDEACYGEVGRSEKDLRSLGFASISLDPLGRYIYVVDRANTQVLVVDAPRQRLIDVYEATGSDRRPFSSQIGVPIPPAPMVVAGRVKRDITWRDPRPEVCDPRGDCRHAVVRYQYGASVATDGGQAYNLSAATAYCEVELAEGERLISNDEFYYGSAELLASPERHCLYAPEFPVDYDLEACELLETCEVCEGTAGGCDSACDDPELLLSDCVGERVHEEEGARVVFNPTMQLQDSDQRPGRMRGVGSCDSPDSLINALRESVPGQVDTSCTSELRPQPVSPMTRPAEMRDARFDRAELLQKSTLILSDEGGQAQSGAAHEVELNALISPDDRALLSETWSVTWEGIIPKTRREDGLLAVDEPGELTVAGLNLCSGGVEPGDRLTIRSQPVAAGASSAELPAGCEDFEAPDDQKDFLTWSISEVTPSGLSLEVISAGDDDERAYAQALPSRECFAEGVSYEIRVHDEWTVVGERSGFLSKNMSLYNTCQPVFGADTPRFNSRVKTGERFEGPYLSFELSEGAVAPSRDERELVYRFGVEGNYLPEANRTSAMLPSDMLIVGSMASGPWMMLADPGSDSVYVRDLSRPRDDGAYLIQ